MKINSSSSGIISTSSRVTQNVSRETFIELFRALGASKKELIERLRSEANIQERRRLVGRIKEINAALRGISRHL